MLDWNKLEGVEFAKELVETKYLEHSVGYNSTS
jgi:hypothetical protein